jgi:hypothetical protein
MRREGCDRDVTLALKRDSDGILLRRCVEVVDGRGEDT